ncbi:MAG: MMPL family transporter [Pedosphaera parvula]|nr:MMPL family transporter [Pedosphaera parvula]
MPLPKESPVEKALRGLAHVVYHYPRCVFYPTAILLLACVLYTVACLQFNTDRNALVGADKKYHRNFLEFTHEFQSQDDIVAVVESDDREKNRQFVERLAAKLEARSDVFTNVFYKGDLTMLGPKALLFLPEATLKDLRQTLRDYRPFIQNFSQATNLYSLFRLVNKQFLDASLRPTAEAEAEAESMIKALPALEGIVRQATDSLKRPGMPPSPGVTALFGGGEEAEQGQYIAYDHGRIYLVTMHALNDEIEFDAVQQLRALVEETRREVPGVNVGITGEPVLEYDEMSQSQRDTTLASIVALVLVVLIFVYAYRETGRPLKATWCLIVGIGFTLGFTTVTVGHLNILSITFVPMLIGLAIDFGVHLISRYE